MIQFTVELQLLEHMARLPRLFLTAIFRNKTHTLLDSNSSKYPSSVVGVRLSVRGVLFVCVFTNLSQPHLSRVSLERHSVFKC